MPALVGADLCVCPEFAVLIFLERGQTLGSAPTSRFINIEMRGKNGVRLGNLLTEKEDIYHFIVLNVRRSYEQTNSYGL